LRPAFQRTANLAKSIATSNLATFLALTALNLSIAWRLLKVEYTDHFSSVEGYFIAIARYVSSHWGDLSWFPLWHCGMPYADTYVPLLHLVVAATAGLGHISAARAYHGVTGVTQWGNYRWRARLDIQRPDLEKRSEYTSARWLDANLHGGRVYVTGSTAFWLNAFTAAPQLIGCCDQGQSMPVLNEGPYKVNTAVNPAITEEGIDWLRALGVQAVVVNGPTSTDEYKDIRAPQRFDGVLPLLHRENGDSIYLVLPLGSSLAHVVRPEELVPHRARGNFAYADIRKYARATGDAARPAAAFEWRGSGKAVIRANLHPDDLLSVQVAWFPGWKAAVRGVAKPVSPDGMGFIVIQPHCRGDCDIDLAWTGRGDLPLTAAVSLATLGLLAFLSFRRFPARRAQDSSPVR
jgi:hypothetical protein